MRSRVRVKSRFRVRFKIRFRVKFRVRDFCPGTVPAIFVPVQSVPRESVSIPVPWDPNPMGAKSHCPSLV